MKKGYVLLIGMVAIVAYVHLQSEISDGKAAGLKARWVSEPTNCAYEMSASLDALNTNRNFEIALLSDGSLAWRNSRPSPQLPQPPAVGTQPRPTPQPEPPQAHPSNAPQPPK